MDDYDRTFEALKRTDFRTVRNIINDRVTVNPQTFQLTLHEFYHHIIVDHGWNVDDFITKLNDYRFK